MDTRAPSQTREKKLYIEVMRAIAIFFVIFNHNGFFLFAQYPAASVQYWGGMYLSVFCKFAVPLFFAISGALMLNRPQEPLWKLWTGRILKFALILLLGSLYAYLADIGLLEHPGYALQQFDWKVFIKQIYSIDLRTHFWYLYAYIAFLILLPVLRTLVQNLDTKYFWYIIIIAFICKGLLPVAEYLVWKGEYTLNESFAIGWIIEDVVLFPCVGYFLEHRSQLHKSGKKVALLWAANILTILVACCMTHFRAGIMGVCSEPVSQYFHKSFDLVGCITMYSTVRYLCEHVSFPQWCRRMFFSMGECTFGIFFFHMLVELELGKKLIGALVSEPMLQSFVFCGYTLLACWLLTWVLKKVPGIKWLL